MQWNEINHNSQMSVIEKIYQLIVKENDPEMRRYLVAAAYELELWSNAPCPIEDGIVDLSDEEYVAIAQEAFIEKKSDSILSMIFGKKS